MVCPCPKPGPEFLMPHVVVFLCLMWHEIPPQYVILITKTMSLECKVNIYCLLYTCTNIKTKSKEQRVLYYFYKEKGSMSKKNFERRLQ
jgi:hypothetical protein